MRRPRALRPGRRADAETIPQLRCRVICGAANNQLGDPESGDLLRARGILYAPDYVVNAGGIINIDEEFVGYDPVRAEARGAAHLRDDAARARASARGATTPAAAADAIAEERIAAGRQRERVAVRRPAPPRGASPERGARAARHPRLRRRYSESSMPPSGLQRPGGPAGVALVRGPGRRWRYARRGRARR